jgi:FkbM family methyltransferase
MSQSLRATLSYILRHPLNRGRPAQALSRFLGWQVGSRFRSPIAVPFVGGTRLLVERGMTGATGNVYCGLNDFEEMTFVLHALRPGDLFFDVGANVGSYTVLAAGAAGAKCLAFEAVPATFEHLLRNIALNDLGERVTAHPIAVGAAAGSIWFTSQWGVANHAVADGETSQDAVSVPVRPLDDFWPDPAPSLALLKIDVEGLEVEVINGASKAIRHPSVKAVIMELLNGAGTRYGYDDWALHARMLDLGFRLHRYDPASRTLESTEEIIGGNNLYVRDPEILRERVQTAPLHEVHGTRI